MTFEEWMGDLDVLCNENIGVSLLDLPDQTFHDWYDAGLSVDEAMDAIVEREGLRW